LARAAGSIATNLTEEYGRYFIKGADNFTFSQGAMQETKAWLSKCKRRIIIGAAEAEALLQKANVLLLKLNTYIKFTAAFSNTTVKKIESLLPGVNLLINQLPN
jgi:four helix bundle protein